MGRVCGRGTRKIELIFADPGLERVNSSSANQPSSYILGVPIAAGLYLSLAVRGGWRKSAAFAAGVLLFCQPHVAFNSAGSQ